MPYEGEILSECPADLDFQNTSAVVVSGATWNPCGHMILSCGTSSIDSWYFHVAGQQAGHWWEKSGILAYPKFMRGDANLARYLGENGKKEIRRLDAKIMNPSGAYMKLTSFMSDKWFWKVLPHNCAAFVKEIVKAGGGDLSVLLNCPDQEFVRQVGQAMDQGLKSLPRGPKY